MSKTLMYKVMTTLSYQRTSTNKELDCFNGDTVVTQCIHNAQQVGLGTPSMRYPAMCFQYNVKNFLKCGNYLILSVKAPSFHISNNGVKSAILQDNG